MPTKSTRLQLDETARIWSRETKFAEIPFFVEKYTSLGGLVHGIRFHSSTSPFANFNEIDPGEIRGKKRRRRRRTRSGAETFLRNYEHVASLLSYG